MHQQLLPYYERELAYLRHLGSDFAQRYPKIASRLSLSADKCEDPHVERLIESVAFLTARVHRKIDDEFPEITDALLQLLLPHYLAPIPSFAIVQFVLDPDQGKSPTGHLIDRESVLYSPPVQGLPCRFRTGYPVSLWPLEVVSVAFEHGHQLPGRSQTSTVLRLQLNCQAGAVLSELALSELRFFLHGEGAAVHDLYELLFNHTREVQLRPVSGDGTLRPVLLPADCIRPVGFAPEEGLLPYPAQSFVGYRLLHEYFAYPEKFHFFDLTGLDRAVRAGYRRGMEILFYLDRPPRSERIHPSMFRLGCTPVVNLFDQMVEPIRVDELQTEYRIVADVRRQMATEIYRVNTVTCTQADAETSMVIPPLYATAHAVPRDTPEAFYTLARRPSPRQDDAGTEVYLSIVDLSMRPASLAGQTLTIHATCTNRDLPGKLPFGGERKGMSPGDLELEAAAPITCVRTLTKPTDTIRPPLGKDAQWRLLSHLSLNYLSLCGGGCEAFQELLRLYNFSDKAALRDQIEGITKVMSRRIVRRPSTMPWNGLCRGLEVTIEFDEERYVGGGVFLMAAVLERFVGLYTSINSFTQLVATSQQRERPLRRWAPRAGEQVLL